MAPDAVFSSANVLAESRGARGGRLLLTRSAVFAGFTQWTRKLYLRRRDHGPIQHETLRINPHELSDRYAKSVRIPACERAARWSA